MAQAQLMAQQDIANQNVALQQQIADQQQAQAQQALAFQQQQAAEQQQQAEYQAQLQSVYDQGRQEQLDAATNWINNTFAPYDQNYFDQYEKDYTNALMPAVQQQYGAAKGNLLFGLARSGMLNSQAHADQQGLLDQKMGQTASDIATQATQAAKNLQQQIGQQKQNLMTQFMNTGALGQPVAPGTVDEVVSSIDNTSRSIGQIAAGAQDQLASLGQLPTASSLGNIFGSLGSAIGNYQSGANAYQIGAASGVGSAGAGLGPSAPGIG